MTIQEVLVVGSGLMGSGISQVCAQAGIEVFITDVDQEAPTRAQKNIVWSVGKFIEKGKVAERLETIMARIQAVKDLTTAVRTGDPRWFPSHDSEMKSQGWTTWPQDRPGLV